MQLSNGGHEITEHIHKSNGFEYEPAKLGQEGTGWFCLVLDPVPVFTTAENAAGDQIAKLAGKAGGLKA